MGRPAHQWSLNKKGFWVGKFPNPNGGRKIEKTLCRVQDLPRGKKAAEARLLELWLAKQPTIIAPAPAPQKQANTALDTEKQAFLAFIANERDPRTLSEYSHVLRDIKDMADVDTLREKWLRDGLSPHTVNKKLRTIARFENWRVKTANNSRKAAGLPMLAPRTWEKAPADRRTIRSWTAADLDAMLDYIERKIIDVEDRYRERWVLLRRAYFLLRFTGMRGSEVNSLRWQDVILNAEGDDSFIKIESHDDFNVKGDHEELMPIAFDSMIREMKTWAQDHKFVLRNHWKGGDELGKAFKKIQTALGLARATKPQHGFRAHFATQLYKLGAADLYVQRALRHSSIETTKRYVDARNDGRGAYLRSLTAGL